MTLNRAREIRSAAVGFVPRRNQFGRAEQAADVVCMASNHRWSDNHAYVSRFPIGTPTKTLRASWLPVSRVWAANTLETVTGFETVALLVVPIELIGVLLAGNPVGAVAERLGVR